MHFVIYNIVNIHDIITYFVNESLPTLHFGYNIV